jgi:hypothetical protein
MSNEKKPERRPSTQEATWDEFRSAGLLWWINTALHVFGWAINVEVDEADFVKRVYPARVAYRGFSPDRNEAGYIRLTQHMAAERDRLLDDLDLPSPPSQRSAKGVG